MSNVLINKIFGITIVIFCALSIIDRFAVFDKTVGNIIDNVIVVTMIGFVATQDYRTKK